MKKTPDIPTQREMIAWAKSANLYIRLIDNGHAIKIPGVVDYFPILTTKQRAGLTGIEHEWAPWRFASHAAPLVDALGLSIILGVNGWGYSCVPVGDGVVIKWQPGHAYESYSRAAIAAVREKLKEGKP